MEKGNSESSTTGESAATSAAAGGSALPAPDETGPDEWDNDDGTRSERTVSADGTIRVQIIDPSGSVVREEFGVPDSAPGKGGFVNWTAFDADGNQVSS